MEATLNKFEAAYTGEEILAFCTSYTWKHWAGINEVDREEVICQMALGMAEAANRAEPGQNVRAFQWSYAKGYAMKWFELRGEVAAMENIRIDYHHGDDGDCEGEGRSLTMADTMADQTLPEDLSPAMKEALDSLSREEREIIRLRFLEGKDAEETLQALGISCRTDCSTFRMQTYRLEQAALAKLKRFLTVKAA